MLKSFFQSALRYSCLFIMFTSFNVSAQITTFPVNGIHDDAHVVYAFKNATIYTSSSTRIENATLIIKDGRVLKVGVLVTIPKGAVIKDLQGKYIYPSFIDLYSNYGMPKIEPSKWTPVPQLDSKTDGAFSWNESVKPETKASSMFISNSKTAVSYRNSGIGVVLTHQWDGIVRGTSILTTVADDKENATVLLGDAAAQYSFSKGSSKQVYPSSLMGSIALLRQTYYNAKWYAENETVEKNLSFDAFNKEKELPQIFAADNLWSVLRADKVGDEFAVQYIIKTNGDCYQRIDEIAKTQARLIVPVKFPLPYDIQDPYDAELVSYAQLKHWELAPTNPAVLEKNGLYFAFTSAGLTDTKDFLPNIRKAVHYGLSKETALKALTIIPAEMINMDDEIGSLQKGMMANFLITSGDVFNEGTILYENWIKGVPYQINDMDIVDVRGTYNVNINDVIYPLEVTGTLEKPKGTIKTSALKKDSPQNNKVDSMISVDLQVNKRLISLAFFSPILKQKGTIMLSGNINFNSGIWDGQGQLSDGSWVEWTAIKNKEFIDESKPKISSDTLFIGKVTYPNMAFGWDSLPVQQCYLIKNATVWTNEQEGILKNADIAVKDGKIVGVGVALDSSIYFQPTDSVIIIDATGKVLTSGIIDEHSHLAISGGVNESGQACSAEVRIGDVINAEDINIYRQLSGGVTASQLLHGSANPIGGQSGIIKLRWGMMPDSMKIANASGFIKFALGENVKQSNWGDYQTVRYPQTRMGVEQVFYDNLIRAKVYAEKWAEYNNLSAKKKEKTHAPRVDLELDALSEVLHHQRFITCHSYVQSEINMLIHVADSLGFTINTFTHVLEGYKVADKMLEHGSGVSTFSDWWAYKFEVRDAIPYNGAIMHDVGLTVAFNSDDAEMARRLNQEAAKAVKYGGVTPEEAWKFVTLNPAKLLHLDKQMGSVKVGKDADLVLWSGNPLSIYSKAEITMIDGTIFYSLEEDKSLREMMKKDRLRIIANIAKSKKKTGKSQPPVEPITPEYGCERIK